MIDQAIYNLNRLGIRAERGYPGKRLPELTQPRVAVSVYRWEPDADSVTLRASVMSPASLGGGVCEDIAGLVCRVLGQLGGVCVQNGCENVSRTELLCVPITAVFRQEKQVRFSVSVGDTQVTGADAFAAWRSKPEEGIALESVGWNFRLEARDVQENLFPAEPCGISVQREGRVEHYTGCVLTSHRVEIDPEGLRAVWEGTAEERVTE